VAELGSQNVWCPQKTMMRNLFRAFGREAPPEAVIESFANWTGSARDLYEHLGMTYACIDVDARFGSLMLDLNFDELPREHRNRYDLTTNHGTAEHVLNQSNVFKTMHDLTASGGLLLHAVPFTVHLEHGFFNYSVDFFRAMAAANGYQTLGVWVGPDWQLGSLVPWHPSLMQHLTFSAKTTHLLVTLHRKTAATAFRPPRDGDVGESAAEWSASPYCQVVDAESYEGTRNRFVSVTGGRGPLSRSPRGVPKLPPIDPASDAGTHAAPAGRSAAARALTPSIITLYRQLKVLGIADGVHSVLELGSSPLDCPGGLVRDLMHAFGRREGVTALKVSRDLYEALGLTCTSVDVTAGPGMLELDLECETAPVEHANRYDLVTNIGAGASLLNQRNVFEAAHAFARPGGFMLHALPFRISSGGSLVAYQPNLFEALARYNSYRTLGTWVAVDAQVPCLIPWQASLLDYLVMSEATAHTFVVLFQKMFANDFCIPFQECYEGSVAPGVLSRYPMVVDGLYADRAVASSPASPPPAPPTPSPSPTPPAPSVGLVETPSVDLVRELKRRVRLRLGSLLTGRLRQAFKKPATGRTRPPSA
jgi:hypothetical protein